MEEHLYELYAHEWRDPDEPLLDRDAFRASLVPRDLSALRCMQYRVLYSAQDLFAGHDVEAVLGSEDEVLRIDL